MCKLIIYESSKYNGHRVARLPDPEPLPNHAASEMKLIQVYSDLEEQTVHGFGGAFTQAAATVFNNMRPDLQQEILLLTFGRNGLAYNSGRVPIGACDFSDGNYSYCDTANDTALNSFSIERDQQLVFPLIQQATACAPSMELLASPWSPPAWMKTNGDMLHGGALKKEYYPVYARYLALYLLECRKLNIPVNMLTVQNEPHAVQTWESCIYSDQDELIFIRDYLVPEFHRSGLSDIRLLIWDHNKEHTFLRTEALLQDPHVASSVAGIAFHWYSGDHFENLALCRKHFPALDLVFSEGCVELTAFDTAIAEKALAVGGSGDAAVGAWEYGEFYAHDIIGNFRSGMNRFIDWNLFLDRQGGPNHVGNYCSAPIILDTEAQKILLQPSYYYIKHFSAFVPRGSRVVALSRYTSALEAVAFKRPDRSVVTVIMNPTEAVIPFNLYMVREAQTWQLESQPKSIMTAVYTSEAE